VSASSDLGKIKFGDSYYYVKHQVYFGLSIGLIGFFFGYLIYYQWYRKIAFPILLVSIALLTLVFTKYGITANSASRWIRIGPVNFQPAELLKLTFIIYLAAWLSNPKANRSQTFYEGLVPFLVVASTITLLLLLQPATSIVVILMTAAMCVYFVNGAHMRYIMSIVLISLAGLAVIIYLTPYRFERVSGFLHLNSDKQGANYHLNQAMIAIGSGGLFGTGYGQSTAKVNYLPAAIDDSIFAVIAQELGFVGAGGLIILFGLLTFRLLWLALRSRDRFGKLLLIGFASIIACQSIIHIAANSGLAPLTGVPLPFVSYGGTALAVFLTMAGISVNVSKYV
jgi:cell division protein FtsW